MVRLGVVFNDVTKLPSDTEELKKFFNTMIAPALYAKYANAAGIERDANPGLDDRGVDIGVSIGIHF